LAMTSLNITLSMNDAFQSGFVPILKKCRVARIVNCIQYAV
jgi:hypothetical protein